MSLINQMLQDLEKRRASGTERGALPNQVRVLPLADTRGSSWRLFGIVAAGILIGALAWHFSSRRPVVADAARGAPAPTMQLAPGAPASRLALELEKAPSNVARSAVRPAGATVALPVPNAATLAARPAAEAKIAQAPLSTAAVVAPEAAAAKSAAVAARVEPAKAAAPPAETSPAAVVAAKPPVAAPRTVDVSVETKGQALAANAQIDKRAQILTPQQLAENDYREAANFLNQGRLAEAQEGFRRALQHNPAHAGARQGLFGLLLDAKKSSEAEQLLRDGLKLNPNQPAFAIALSSLQFERGDVGDAIETMQKTAPAAQSSPDYLARLAGMLQRQSRHREAVEQYQAALRLAPQAGVWLMGMGISLQALSRNGEAQDAFRRARASNSLSAELQAFVDQRLRQLQ